MLNASGVVSVYLVKFMDLRGSVWADQSKMGRIPYDIPTISNNSNLDY